MVLIEELDNVNFLYVYFIASEIKRELEIALNSKIYIPESYIYSQKNPNFPCFSDTRYKTLYYLKNIGEIEEFHKVNRGRIGITVISQDKFFLFFNRLISMHNNRFTKPGTLQKKKEQRVIKKTDLLVSNAKPEKDINGLSYFSDGTIRYNEKIIDMRNQLKDLCRLFLDNPSRLLTIDDIRETLIPAKKRATTPNLTISKYVSELRKILEKNTSKNLIQNQKEEGWIFKI